MSFETARDIGRETDELVSQARTLAETLNGTLDTLAKRGVVTVSVIGAPPSPYENQAGLYRSIDRVSLCLDFKPSAKPEDAA